jgi:engulfment/cell motility protein 1
VDIHCRSFIIYSIDLGTNAAGTSTTEKLPPPPGSVYRFGFDVVYEEMKREQGLLDVVVGRIGGAESSMVLYRCVLKRLVLST